MGTVQQETFGRRLKLQANKLYCLAARLENLGHKEEADAARFVAVMVESLSKEALDLGPGPHYNDGHGRHREAGRA